MEISYSHSKPFLGASAMAVSVGLLSALYLYWKLRLRHRQAPLDIRVVTNETQCDAVIEELRNRCLIHRAVGFDCEWVSHGSSRQPVAMLQLSSYDGLCGLFRLCQMNTVPNSLKEFLEDNRTYKVGVVPMDDAKYLTQDYFIVPSHTLDIRHIVQLCGHKTGGLATLAKVHLGLTMDKHWKIRCSDWEAELLSERQQLYAATDAYVAVKIFVDLMVQYHRKKRFLFFPSYVDDVKLCDDIDQTCQRFSDLSFKAQRAVDVGASRMFGKKSGKERSEKKKYSISTRSKPLYQNCFMLAPDGELLCTCDDKKAQWYIDKGLADRVKDAPLTVQLRFEPAGRATGAVGRYYQLAKENRCVVCGQANSYIRKNVVPREYRKFFPDIMKDHSSHDVVLLCLSCHRRSNGSDQLVRRRLAERCGAPLTPADPRLDAKFIEDAVVKSVRSAARALLNDSKKHNLPVARRQELEQIVLKHFPSCNEITNELLLESQGLQVLFENEQYESHGGKVVEHYVHNEGGLIKLEKLWREHFLNTMHPQYLPELWCINHNEERLMIRVQEGRISDADIKIVGLEIS